MNLVSRFKGVSITLVFVLALALVVPPFSQAFASEKQNSMINQKVYYNYDLPNKQEVIANQDNIVEPMVLPLLINIVIRAGVAVSARISAGATVRITSHAASRAVERGMSSKVLDASLSYGTKYKDLTTGARITWDSSSRAAAVIDANANNISTVYFQNAPKAVWIRSNWSW